MQGFRYFITTALILVFSYAPARTQTVNKYGVAVIDSRKEFERSIREDSIKAVEYIINHVPGVKIDLRYSTLNNFMNRRMYPANTKDAFLRLPAALALAAVQKELNERSLGIKVWDAYRPYAVTVAFWELVHDDRYVADPSKGSGHNRGIAIDLTLINIKTGLELPMGTDYDNFSDTAHHSFTQLDPTILANRTLLKTLMEKHGFTAFATEWWHYSLLNGSKYELLDLPFESLRKIAAAKTKN